MLNIQERKKTIMRL